MKIGLIVDGDSEYYSLAKVLSRVQTDDQILNPLLADIQPLAPAAQVARVVRPGILTLASRGVERVVVLLDLEHRAPCAGPWATELRGAIVGGCADCGVPDLRIVLKRRMYENWLVGDLDALRRMPARFAVPASAVASVVPNKADNIDALALLKAAARKTPYHKTNDAQRIMQRADPLVIGQNSRSFRKLLQLVGSTVYAGQTLVPAD
jgi:hypothetical protein